MEAQTSWLVTPETKLRDSIATAANSIRQATSSNQKPHERDQKQIADELAAAWNADYGRGSPMSSPDVFETRPAGEAAPKRKRTKKEARKRALAEAKEEELAALRRQCDELQQSRDAGHMTSLLEDYSRSLQEHKTALAAYEAHGNTFLGGSHWCLGSATTRSARIAPLEAITVAQSETEPSTTPRTSGATDRSSRYTHLPPVKPLGRAPSNDSLFSRTKAASVPCSRSALPRSS